MNFLEKENMQVRKICDDCDSKDISNESIESLEQDILNVCKSLYSEILDVDQIGTTDNFFSLGGDSVRMIKLLSEIERIYNINISFDQFIDGASLDSISRYIAREVRNQSTRGNEKETSIMPSSKLDFRIEPDKKLETFPLSELQESYFIGRKSEEEYNGIPTNAYLELECDCYEHDKLCRIMNKLIKRHDMLRCSINQEGLQKIHDSIPEYSIEILDISYLSKEEQEKKLLNIRKQMLRMKIDFEEPPLLITKVTKLNDNTAVIHFYVDGLIMDGWSYEVFHGELEKWYNDENIEFPPIEASYRDYIRYKKAFKETTKYKADKEYWQEKIKNFPEAGTLPTLNQLNELKDITGNQIRCALPIDEWNAIERKARQYGVTPFSVLFTSFALVIARWNYKQKFLLNIPEFDRPDFHPDVKKILGICSAFLLFTVDNTTKETFFQIVKRNQKELMELIEHHSFSGMEVLREIYKKDNAFNKALVPIVFGLTPDLPHIGKRLMKMRYQENHTSQIWIDINTVIYDEFIEFNWNCIENFIDTRMLSDMVEIQKEILRKVVYEDKFWEGEVSIPLPEFDSNIINNSNSTEKESIFECIGSMLEKNFIKNKKNICLITDDKEYTYEEIHRYVKAFACKLVSSGCKKGDYVCIYVDKSIEQIISVMAVAYIGAVYVPIEYSYPKQLVLKCLENIKCKTVIISNEKSGMTEGKEVKEIIPLISDMKGIMLEGPELTNEDSLISVIHTSGSTGLPKAVMVGQKGLLNCLKFTNEKFEVTSEDMCIALTNLAHDMSMYDIFGMISVGGKILIPRAISAKDPAYWITIMKEHKVTVWNSVPAILQMLVDYIDYNDYEIFNALRLVILGGDYLHPKLASEIKKMNSNIRLINVGGPTETTLWNIYHEVTLEDIENELIPYGKPIDNTKYHVLNEKMEQVPIGVTGMMYCAGVGVTKGYIGDISSTNQKYRIFDATGERIYNTGDLGKYNANGELIFMGREDFQVKINGKRIELNGIASVIRNIQGITNCAVKLGKDKQSILAYYVSDEEFNVNYLKEKILEYLPNYMIPKHFVRMQDIPLTSNGKVDRNALSEDFGIEENACDIIIEPQNAVERDLVEICSEILNQPVYVNSDFFIMGGNSILAIKLLSRIREKYHIKIGLTEVFSTSSIGEWASIIINKLDEKKEISEKIGNNKWIFHSVNHPSSKISLFCFPYAGGSAMYYTSWNKYLSDKINLWPVQYPFRENRQKEQMPSSLEELAYNMACESKELFDRPFAFYGHCTGSIIAFEVAKQVKKLYDKEPEFFIASANVSPRYSILDSTEGLSDKDFIQILSNYGLVDSVMFEDEDFASYFIPIIRADFSLHERYRCMDMTPLNCPIYTFNGTKDQSIESMDMVDDWMTFTSKDYQSEIFEGGHFFIDKHKKDICKRIEKLL